MEPERWEQIGRICLLAQQREPAERASFLEEACAGDESLRMEVERLLAYEEGTGSFLESPALEVAARALARDLASDTARDLTGRTLSHFRIAEKIGSGGMGIVYRAQDEHLHRDVAVKILAAGTFSDKCSRNRLRKEALAVARLNHANIAGVYDFDSQDGIDFLVMEYVPGMTLDRKLASGPLSEKEILRLAMQLAEGLSAAQAHGIVHRDLKPRNLIVTAEGQLKILDFGLATLIQPSNTAGKTQSSEDPFRGWGTHQYMSPEQLLGDPVDIRSDIYAVGTILYEAITGRLPFHGPTSAALTENILRQLPVPPGRQRSGLSPRLEDLVLKCLEKDPENRYQSAREMMVDLRRMSMPPMTHVTLSSPAPHGRIRKWLLASALTAAAILAFAAGLWIARYEAPLPDCQPFQLTRAPGWQGDPAISPDGQQIAYSSDKSGNLDLFLCNSQGSAITQLTYDPAEDSQPCWFPAGDAIAFTSRRERTEAVWRVEPASGKERLLVANASHAAISPDGRRVAFARRTATNALLRIWVASIADPSDARPVTSNDAGPGDHNHPAWSPDGSKICYSSQHGLWIISADGGPPQCLTPEQELDIDPVWPNHSPFIYFASYRHMILAIWRVSIDSGKAKLVTTGTGSESHPSVSRDGKRLVYGTGANVGRQQTFLVDRKSGSESLAFPKDWENMTSISPDSSRIVFTSVSGSEYTNLWVQDLNGHLLTGTPRQLTFNTDNASHPTYSPDGQWIAYYRIIGKQRDIWTIHVHGGLQVQITDHAAKDIHPSWSPDGTELAFISDRSNGQHVWVIPVKNGRPAGEPRQVSRGNVYTMAPAWFPDGKRLMFVGYENDRSELWEVAADGKSDAKPITRGADVWRARWDPWNHNVLASAAWGEDRVLLWSISPTTGMGRRVVPEIEFGIAKTALGEFDLSRDGGLLIYTRTNSLNGNLWILEATRGQF